MFDAVIAKTVNNKYFPSYSSVSHGSDIYDAPIDLSDIIVVFAASPNVADVDPSSLYL